MPVLERLRHMSRHVAVHEAPPASPPLTVVGTVGSGMQISTVEALHVDRATMQGGGTSLVFVKIVTDTGIVGWGEATNSGRNNATAEAVMEGARYLYGKDPFEIERHWQHIYRGTFRRGGPILCSALAGIESAKPCRDRLAH
jgi:L-alanine-DL-glutamate epimerase-like enolase superfamily enzyme